MLGILYYSLQKYDAATEELNKALATIQSIKDSNGRKIHCGAGSVSMNHILPRAVSNIRRNHGKININLLEGRTHELPLKLRSVESVLEEFPITLVTRDISS